MADHEFIVLSRPPASVSDAEYNDWYATHVSEILALPGFVDAKRMTARLVGNDPNPELQYTFCTRYDVEGDFESAWRALRSEVDSGRMTFYPWFGEVVAAGWQCTSVAEA